ncbi:hypothetical protein NDU88_006209 [Pleurodeles waltl]|uniref:Uncharacterized protein n=1 Tax=Pleurodeles waltl TaxID=8319 RepID=A0AAV7VP25_PLEWA|nr:hypothetical protein NDU88_006209 [Pleurodeles waltl]
MDGGTPTVTAARKTKEDGGCRVLRSSAAKLEQVEEKTPAALNADRLVRFLTTKSTAATTCNGTCGGGGPPSARSPQETLGSEASRRGAPIFTVLDTRMLTIALGTLVTPVPNEVWLVSRERNG